MCMEIVIAFAAVIQAFFAGVLVFRYVKKQTGIMQEQGRISKRQTVIMEGQSKTSERQTGIMQEQASISEKMATFNEKVDAYERYRHSLSLYRRASEERERIYSRIELLYQQIWEKYAQAKKERSQAKEGGYYEFYIKATEALTVQADRLRARLREDASISSDSITKHLYDAVHAKGEAAIFEELIPELGKEAIELSEKEFDKMAERVKKAMDDVYDLERTVKKKTSEDAPQESEGEAPGAADDGQGQAPE